MAFRIMKQERADIDAELKKLSEERAALEAAYDEFNQALTPAMEKLNGAIQTYNQVKVDTGSFLGSVHERLDGEYEDKSERWQDGERGSEVREWIDGIRSLADEFETEVEEVSIEELSFEEEDFEEKVGNELSDEPGF